MEAKIEDIEISFKEYYNGKHVLTIKIRDKHMNFIGKYKYKGSIISAIQEGDLKELLRNLEFENRTGVEAYFYLLGYLHAREHAR